jgi:hypothetical protein
VAQDDPELRAVTYAFDGAFQRMCEATATDALMAELSNLLHHLYRLRELCRDRLTGFDVTERTTAGLRAARAASWVRNFDTHQLFAVASQEDAFSDRFTAMYGVLVWIPLADLPSQADKKQHREADYAAELEGKVVLDTLRRAFDALVRLLEAP